jgi:hypothetical protein
VIESQRIADGNHHSPTRNESLSPRSQQEADRWDDLQQGDISRLVVPLNRGWKLAPIAGDRYPLDKRSTDSRLFEPNPAASAPTQKSDGSCYDQALLIYYESASEVLAGIGHRRMLTTTLLTRSAISGYRGAPFSFEPSCLRPRLFDQ